MAAFLILGGQGGVAWAEQYIPSGLAAVLVATMPLWILLLSSFRYGGPRPRLLLVAGLAIGFVGVVLLIAPWQVTGRDLHVGGILAVLLGTLAWATGSLYLRTAPLPRLHLLATGMQMLCGGVLVLTVAGVRGELTNLAVADVSAKSLLAVGYLIVFGSLVALTSYTWLLTVVQPSLVQPTLT